MWSLGKLLGSWWIDDYDSFTHSLRRGEVVPVPMTAQRVTDALGRYLGSMLGWSPGQWSQVATEYRDIWTRAWPTKERFDAAQPRWPQPKARFLIDLTDDRFKTDENRNVIDYIRRMNPFAHSDVGDCLIHLGRGVPGSEYYCPAMANYAYIVLHTAKLRIFVIAYGMRSLAFRLPESAVVEALADGGTVKPNIGADWVAFDPWRVDEATPVTLERVQRWCERAYHHAAAQP